MCIKSMGFYKAWYCEGYWQIISFDSILEAYPVHGSCGLYQHEIQASMNFYIFQKQETNLTFYNWKFFSFVFLWPKL